ncbi:MAG: T9SS type A sorting domain-containing protein [Bacteroidia bacterium]
MKKITTLSFAVIFCGMASLLFGQGCANSSNIYTFKYNGKKYEIVKEQKSWVDADACAVARGGYLVQINSKAEQDSVYHALVSGSGISSTYTVVNDGGGIAYVWIGATDKKTEGEWLWDGNNDGVGANFWNGQGNAGPIGGGSAVGGAFVNWGGASTGTYHEPDNYNGNQNAAGIALGTWPYGKPGEWNDINQSNTLYYIIEYDSASSSGYNTPVNENKNVFVYPNPANNLVNISTSNSENISSVSIMNFAGELFSKQIFTAKNSQLNISDLRPGIYFLDIELASGSKVLKKIFCGL